MDDVLLEFALNTEWKECYWHQTAAVIWCITYDWTKSAAQGTTQINGLELSWDCNEACVNSVVLRPISIRSRDTNNPQYKSTQCNDRAIIIDDVAMISEKEKNGVRTEFLKLVLFSVLSERPTQGLVWWAGSKCQLKNTVGQTQWQNTASFTHLIKWYWIAVQNVRWYMSHLVT